LPTRSMKILILGLLVSTTAFANQCTPEKSNPKNEQCAKDLMKDGIGSLPSSLQNQLLEPLVNSFTKKLVKDLMHDMNSCQEPKNPQNECQSGSISKPSSEQGKKMFENAAKDFDKNANELVKGVNEKIGEIEKKLGNKVTDNLKHLLGDAMNNANVSNLLGGVQQPFKDALRGLKKKMEGAIAGGLGDAAKEKLEELKKIVTEMPQARLDFINKQLKGQAGNLVNRTLEPLKKEIKGIVDGLLEPLKLEGMNITDLHISALVPKFEWLKKKLDIVANEYGLQFDIDAADITKVVFVQFWANIPEEFKEIISLHDVVFLGPHLLEAFNKTIDDVEKFFEGSGNSTDV
ncbi:hypothetical protein PMAYCL1PPCAC_32925, partial [Pristionchus mayeri]